MMSRKPLCECGRRALSLGAPRAKSARSIKRRRPIVRADHPLCLQCASKLFDSVGAVIRNRKEAKPCPT